MDDVDRGAVEGTGVRAPAAPCREQRMAAGRKREAVLRLLRGEPLEVVAREPAVPTVASMAASRAQIPPNETLPDAIDQAAW